MGMFSRQTLLELSGLKAQGHPIGVCKNKPKCLVVYGKTRTISEVDVCLVLKAIGPGVEHKEDA